MPKNLLVSSALTDKMDRLLHMETTTFTTSTHAHQV